MELSQPNEDDPKRANSVSVDHFKEEDGLERSSYSSVSSVNELVASKENMSVGDDLNLCTHAPKERKRERFKFERRRIVSP